ncbi:hypothetical protein [Vibrio cholerae]|uniref:hypothetical protein n=1 Tax=Vibrio cholerae TaxID=666 RepID=UPI000E6CE220|nr:hypothetical protein [Vibrio cholerae]NOF31554.1 hypothetical protein [Vibrio cholerae]RJK82862.1 hypothetical protein CHN45_17285 [Vibrio cholerae]
MNITNSNQFTFFIRDLLEYLGIHYLNIKTDEALVFRCNGYECRIENANSLQKNSILLFVKLNLTLDSARYLIQLNSDFSKLLDSYLCHNNSLGICLVRHTAILSSPQLVLDFIVETADIADLVKEELSKYDID